MAEAPLKMHTRNFAQTLTCTPRKLSVRLFCDIVGPLEVGVSATVVGIEWCGRELKEVVAVDAAVHGIHSPHANEGSLHWRRNDWTTWSYTAA